jgi:hypothetical protein
MYELEDAIDPVDLTLPDGDVVRIAAVYPEGRPKPSFPFDLPPPVPMFGPVLLDAQPGGVAIFFGTRARAVTEGPRRTGLGENVLVCNGGYLDARLGPGFEPVDAPPWGVLSMTAQFAFPLAGRGVDAASEIMFKASEGRGHLMSVEQRQGYRDAVASAFAAFIADNPGLTDLLERGLALMDAQIMRFEGERLVEVSEREAAILAQGAEVLEEAAGFEVSHPSP